MKWSSSLPLRGYILLLALVVSSIAITVTVGFLDYYASAVRAERYSLASAQARALAEAGIDKAVYELNQGGGYSGESGTVLGNGTFSISVASIDGNSKRITATGFVPNSANPTATKVIQTTVGIDSSVASFHYGVQSGFGGIEFANHSCVIGNVYSNGSIIGAYDASVTGDVWVAGGTALRADQQHTASNNDFTFGRTSPVVDLAQGFQLSEDNVLNKVGFYIKKVGNPSDATVRILTDADDVPSKTVVVSGTLTASAVMTNYGWVDVFFTTPPPLIGGLTYWLAIDAATNASNYWVIGNDTTEGYASGAGMTSANWNATPPVWSSSNSDINFKAWTGGVNTNIDRVTIGQDAHAHRIEDSDIAGDAYYQEIDDTTVDGASYPGSTDPEPVDMPISDGQIQEWKDVAAAGGTVTGNYNVSGSVSLGPAKITGDLTFTNNASLTINGAIWVQGAITTAGNTSISLAPSYGDNSGVIIADGTITIENSTAFSGSGTPGTYVTMITTSSDDEALWLSNNSANSILYAPNGGLTAANNTSMKEVTAAKIYLSNNACVTYESGLINVNFSSGPGGSWAVEPGTYVIMQ